MTYRTLEPGQWAQLWIGGPDLAEPELFLETSEMLIEAPNWSPGGSSLFVNGNGQLWRTELGRRPPELSPVSFTGLPQINNDHVLSPDGRHIYLSAMDGHIYRGPSAAAMWSGSPVRSASGTSCMACLRTAHASPTSGSPI